MNLSFLEFISEPWFVFGWYSLGIGGAGWVVYDTYRVNRAVAPALKWAWPIIVLFFSVLGLLLYFATSRPPGVARAEESERERLYCDYTRSTLRRITGSVIHCVGGDGLGIMTAMVISRWVGLGFWREFWFEYAVGFAFGWFIFQYKAMSAMTKSPLKALWMGGRAEFFSMITVMAGMGAVMAFVTPLVVGEQPKPTTASFWGFGALGLLVGFIVTYPMNFVLVRIGWKHGA